MDYDFLLSQSYPQEVFELIKALKVISNSSFPVTIGDFTVQGVEVTIKKEIKKEAVEVPKEVVVVAPVEVAKKKAK